MDETALRDSLIDLRETVLGDRTDLPEVIDARRVQGGGGLSVSPDNVRWREGRGTTGEGGDRERPEERDRASSSSYGFPISSVGEGDWF